MRVLRTRTRNCERIREYASRRLDGELSQFEETLLSSHLADCAGCRAFAGDVDAIVTQLRSAPLEPLERPITLPSRRSRVGMMRVGFGAAAAVAAVAALVPGLIGLRHSPASTSSAAAARSALVRSALYAATNQDIQDIHVIRATQATPERAFILAHGRGPHPT